MPEMSKPALQIEHLTKRFKNFALDDISFRVQPGEVVGLIGENGSGKSTAIRCILGQDIPDSGTIQIFGADALTDCRIHNRVGVSTDAPCFLDSYTIRNIASILKDAFAKWDDAAFYGFLERFDVPLDRKVKALSKGMKAKLGLAAALGHHPDLLLLDEATSGLDPVVREEILDDLREFMEDEKHAILMTTHITADLERIADRILYIRDGKILLDFGMNELENFGIARLKTEQLEYVDPALIRALRKQSMSVEILTADRAQFARRYPDYVIEPCTLDEMIVILAKGDLK